MAEMSRKDLAAVLGVTPATVTRDAAAGMPTHDIDAARRWRQENRRARVSPPPRAGHAQPPEGAVAAGPAQMPGRQPEPDDDGGDYWTNRARRERAEADLAELKLAEQMGQLVRAADVRSSLSKRLAATREALLQIPARLAPVLAAESDQGRVHDLIQHELHAALQQVTEA